MKFSLFLTAGALAAALVPAQTPQIATTLSTADVVGVHANRETDLARGNTTIDRGLRLTANDGRMAIAGSTAAKAVTRTPAGPGIGARFSARATARGGNIAGTLTGNPQAQGAQTYELTLAAREAVSGRVVVLFDGGARNARAGASVRIGRDLRTFGAAGGAQRDAFDGVSVDSNGVTIAVSIGGTANAANSRSGAAFHTDLQVYFVADQGGGGGGCTVTGGTRSCDAGGVLRGTADDSGRQPVVSLGLAGALPNAIGITLVSPADRTFEIGNTGCIFFLRPITAATFQTDDNGNARTRMTFPRIRGGSFAVHQGTIQVSPRGARIATSNSLVVDCN